MSNIPKIKVSQVVWGYLLQPDSYFSYVEKINQLYCEIHGYEYVVERLEHHGQTDRHPHWAKVKHLERMLYDCDYLFFIDADACFYSHGIAIHNEILPRFLEGKNIMMASDCAAEKIMTNPKVPNTGMVLLRNNDRTKQLIAEWDTICYIPGWEHTKHVWTVEQKAVIYIQKKYPDEFQLEREYYLLNNRYGFFVKHYADGQGANKFENFKEIYHSPIMERNRKLLQR